MQIEDKSRFMAIVYPLRHTEFDFLNLPDNLDVIKDEAFSYPSHWSKQSIRIFDSHLKRKLDKSVYHAIVRVTGMIARHSPGARSSVFWKLCDLLINRRASFNSPAWYNIGVDPEPQASACFIQSLDDSLNSITALAENEIIAYKRGSGTGTNYSRLRGSKEPLSQQGISSGPLPFIQLHNSAAEAIKSGGRTRRAAKMVILNIDHPDAKEFIFCKQQEEEKARALKKAGYSLSFTDKNSAFSSLKYQAANHSIRVTDAFMEKASGIDEDPSWELINRVDGSVAERVDARDLLDNIAYAAWDCGDPGLQFDTTINNWRTVKAHINGSNPCSEYMFVDDSACNLASLRLTAYYNKATKKFDFNQYAEDIKTLINAMDVIVSIAGYPTEKIRANSHKYRPLGLGITDLGSLLLSVGVGYDSYEGRFIAACLMSFVTISGYHASAYIDYNDNPVFAKTEDGDYLRQALYRHVNALDTLSVDNPELYDTWFHPSIKTKAAEVLLHWRRIKNAQISVIAPTGTIGLALGCETLSGEPYYDFMTSKAIVDGSSLESSSTVLLEQLESLYGASAVELYLRGVPLRDIVKPEHRSIFATANGVFPLAPEGHIKMLSALQPFVSGAISKTVNMPNSATVNDVRETIIYAWKQGVKALAIYRDGSKVMQPLTSAGGTDSTESFQSVTYKFAINDVSVHLDLRHDGTQFRKVSIDCGRIGSVYNAYNVLGRMMSTMLDHGIPMVECIGVLEKQAYAPSGFADSKFHYSISDAIVNYIAKAATEKQLLLDAGTSSTVPLSFPTKALRSIALCPNCHEPLIPTGSCATCVKCGKSTGGCG